MNCRQEESAEGDGEVSWVGGFGFRVPAQSIGPGDLDFVDADAAGFSETETDVVPVVLDIC